MLKSTEIVIEQLIIGLLVFEIVALFGWGTPLPEVRAGNGAYQTFFFGVLGVIAAYAAGIVVDRWSDTLLEQLERRIRIKVYLKNTTDCQFYWKNKALPNEPSIRLEIQKKGERLADYHDYLRRRMRITRSLTCLLPALFLAVALLDYRCQSLEVARWVAGGVTFSYYAAFLLICIFWERLMRSGYLVPKTHPKPDLGEFLEKHKKSKLQVHEKLLDGFRFGYHLDPAIIGLALFTLLGSGLLVFLHFQFSSIHIIRILLFLGGIWLTCMVGWAWWRISKTFFTFLRHYESFK
jgi:hypothetical protein